MIDIASFSLKDYILASILIITSCVTTFFSMKALDLDPQWSIDMATKWCAKSEWVYWDTTPFNAVFRDSGSILGKNMMCQTGVYFLFLI